MGCILHYIFICCSRTPLCVRILRPPTPPPKKPSTTTTTKTKKNTKTHTLHAYISKSKGQTCFFSYFKFKVSIFEFFFVFFFFLSRIVYGSSPPHTPITTTIYMYCKFVIFVGRLWFRHKYNAFKELSCTKAKTKSQIIIF